MDIRETWDWKIPIRVRFVRLTGRVRPPKTRYSSRVVGGVFRVLLLLHINLIFPSGAASSQGLENRLENWLSDMSRHRSRLTGYPGNLAAAKALVDTLSAIGVSEILSHRFSALVLS